MRKGRDESPFIPWETVVLMEVPWGFAFFDVATFIFGMPVNMIWAHFTNIEAIRRAVYFLDLIKCDGKSALWCSSSYGAGESFVDLVREYYSTSKRFIVVDSELCDRINTELGIDSTYKAKVVREVAWGLRNALPFIISQFKYNITMIPQLHLPLCEGFQVLMKKHKFEIPTKAVDTDILTCAGVLQRIEELKFCRCCEMYEACVKLVPGISEIIEDDVCYVEVMAKILTPWLVDEQWDSSKWSTRLTPDVMQKIVAKDAAADDARKKVKDDPKLAALIKENLRDYRLFAKREANVLRRLTSFVAKAKRGQKRSHTEMAEQEVVEAATEQEVVEAATEQEVVEAATECRKMVPV